MCRLCGRLVKCIFDSMPSRTVPSIPKRSFSSSIRSAHDQCPRQTLRKTFKINSITSAMPPTYLLPLRAKLHQATAIQQEATPAAQFQNTQPYIPPEGSEQGALYQPAQPDPAPATTSTPKSILSEPISITSSKTDLTIPPTFASPLILSKSLQSLLPALHSQTPHYITTHIHRFPYLITTGDTVRLPFHLHGVSPGDVLRLNRASLLGSREYTLKAGLKGNSEIYDGKRKEPNYLDERLFECRARVMGLESQPMTIKEKTKRRNRRVKRVRSKHRYTVLRVMEVRVKSLEELMNEKGVVLLE